MTMMLGLKSDSEGMVGVMVREWGVMSGGEEVGGDE